MPSIRSLWLYYRERYVFLFTNVSLVAIVLSCAWILWRIGPRSELIPLHYDVLLGIDRFGPWQITFVYPGLALGITLINFVIGYFIFVKDKYLSYYIGLMSTLCSMITLIYLIVLTINVL